MTKILIIRFSSIGDIILTTPVIRCIKSQIPNVELHYLTKKPFLSVINANPYIDKIYSFDRSNNQIINELKKENYDYIIDLHHNLRSEILKFKLGKTSFSFNKLNIEKWLMVKLKINKLPPVHIVDRYFATLSSFNIKNDLKGLDYYITEDEEIKCASLPASHQNGYIGFVIGGQHSTKRLPVEKIISICRKINYPILLLGGTEDKINGERIAIMVGRERIYNACGKYSLNQSASIVRQATKIITHDTGLMHIAAAYKKDIISIWGNTIPEFGMYPYLSGQNSKIVEVKNLPCRPCSKIGYSKCPKKHFYCMNLIDEEAICDN